MIVCLGWGSLIWCQKALPVKGDWQLDGPQLPLEFARKSNDGRITLVVEDRGTICNTLWAQLNVHTLAEALEALRAREGVPQERVTDYIGYWTPQGSSAHPHNAAIAAWAAPQNLTAVWTALPPKSPVTELNGDFPSQADVLAYLAGLTGGERDRAREYIRLAPAQVDTAYRQAIGAALGWTPVGLI